MVVHPVVYLPLFRERGILRQTADKKIYTVEILFYPAIRLHSVVIMNVTPSLPQRGRQRKGSVPLTPLFSRIFTNLQRVYPCVGGRPSGGGGSIRCCSPQERSISKTYNFYRPEKANHRKNLKTGF